MKFEIKDFILLLILSIMGIGMFYAKIINNTVMSFFIAMFIFSLVMFSIRTKLGRWNNVTTIFLVFWGLYIFVGPYVSLTDGMFDPYYYRYSYPYYTNEYLFYNSIGLIGFYLAFQVGKRYNNLLDVKENAKNEINKELILDIGVFIIFLAMLMELTNILRVGGVSIFSAGKEVYQTSISNLKLTLPSTNLSYLALAIFMIGIREEKITTYKIRSSLFGLCLLSFIIINLLIGSRTVLLGYAGIILLGVTYHKKIKGVKIKYILLVILLYFMMIFITTQRYNITQAVSTGNYTTLVEKIFTLETYLDRVSLKQNEFVVGLGNFSEGYIDAKMNSRYGETYIKALALPIPGFLYPGEKPTQILYEFRNTYFAYLNTMEGSVGSTGYSIVLEAYLNFKGVGVFFQYFIIGFIFRRLEFAWNNEENLGVNIFYLVVIPTIYTFSRSQFASVFGDIVYMFLYIVVICRVYKRFLVSKFNKINNLNKNNQ